jgi:hypothetical protein
MKLFVTIFSHLLLLPVLDPNIFLSTLFSNTVNLRPSLNMRDQVSHPYKKSNYSCNAFSVTVDGKTIATGKSSQQFLFQLNVTEELAALSSIKNQSRV